MTCGVMRKVTAVSTSTVGQMTVKATIGEATKH